MSALQGLENDPIINEEFTMILKTCHGLIETYGMEIVMQWIPGHSNIPGNNKGVIHISGDTKCGFFLTLPPYYDTMMTHWSDPSLPMMTGDT